MKTDFYNLLEAKREEYLSKIDNLNKKLTKTDHQKNIIKYYKEELADIIKCLNLLKMENTK